MKKKMKRIFRKHWNCIPWFLTGIAIMAGGEIKKYHFFLTWSIILVLIWFRLPLNDRRLNGTDNMDKGEIQNAV